jgi:hypothetical protein
MAALSRIASVAFISYSVSLTAAGPGSRALFSSDDVVALKLSAPFNELFQHARAEEGYSVTGTVVYPEAGHNVTIDGATFGLRGHTSIRESECTFPKLKIEFPAGAGATAADGTLFAGLKGIKLGTHCGESADDSVTPKYGRLPNEQAPLREVAVYRLLNALGVPTLKARAARVSYVYTDAQPGRTPDQQKPIVRNAMLLENNGEALKRLGAGSELTEEQFTNARERFTPEDTATLAFAEAMIGNFDWCVRMFKGDAYRCDAPHPLWNVTAAVGADGRARPVMYDFDVSGMVAGRHRWFKDVFNATFVASGSPIEVEVLSQVQRTRTLFTRSVLDVARHRFNQRKADVYRVVESATLDPQGRQQIKQYLDAFYAAIGPDEAFYRPVVAAKGTMAFADAEGGAAVCSASGAIPVGTPVSEPIEKSGQRMKVMLLDALWHWAPPIKCDAVHSGAVWIDAAAVSTDFPSASPKQP